NGTAYFKNTTFNVTDFTEGQFDKEARFEDASFTGKTSFENARFKEDALFENATFEDELNLTRARYSKLFIRWHSLQGGLAYDDAAYMSLMKNFKDLGYYEDYDSCYFAYRKAHRSQEDWPSVPDWEEAIRKFIDRPLEWFYGYGTKPFNAFF
ncbi:MAG: pentapeptide repeat-containing protein, partial [Methanothrix sp.]|nr:pentapeptide repeat-containing protein [Methanothrix sp.]